MEPLDPLDQLLRGRSAPPWAERSRAVLAERWPWFVAGGVIVAVVIAILLLRPGGLIPRRARLWFPGGRP